MNPKIDARGLSCPQPVILVKKEMEKFGKGTIEVWVDTAASKENVSRIAIHAGYQVKIEEKDREFLLILTKE